MISRVLLPLDGTDSAVSLVPWLGFLLHQSHAETIVLRVVDVTAKGVLEGLAGVPAEMVHEAEQIVGNVVERLRAANVPARGLVESGKVTDRINDVVDQVSVSMIAMATRGRTGLDRWRKGSVTEAVLRTSQVPVLVLPWIDRAPPRDLAFEHLVVPVDGSDAALEIVPQLAELQRLFGSEITLISAVDNEEDNEKVRKAAGYVEVAKDVLQGHNLRCKAAIRQGDPAEAILAFCQESGADVIAMTTSGMSGIERMLLGSVTEKVLRHSTLPVLVVRDRASMAEQPASDRTPRSTRPPG
jgi:nucleotide-binding universal stress UspA family protein